ncbi:MAG: S41 family peptidase, partial [Bacteroidota bacterium]
WGKKRWLTEDLYVLEYMEVPKIAYLKLNQLRFPPDESKAKVLSEFWKIMDQKPVNKVILDLRSNGGGNLNNAWPFIFKIRQYERINTKSKFLVLTGRKTFSAATAFVSMLETHTNCSFIGEPSGGRPNQTEGINSKPPYLTHLGLDIVVSRGRWTHTDPLDTREFIQPDSIVVESFEDWMAGHDRVFDIAQKL